jgi:amino acid adenylation domain-containing protein/non-ribosomal peptide synthase protein (TIGR01720 family)
VDRFARTWQRVVDRTPALRTSVVWEGVAEPVQVVRRAVRLPVTRHDWTGRTRAEQDAALAELLVRDRAERLDLGSAPLTRVHLVAVAPDEVELLWTFHHVLLDGWSAAAVFAEVCEQYAGAGTPVARRPFRDYLAWLSRQDPEPVERHWRAVLAGLSGPTPLPYDRQPTPSSTARPGETVRQSLTEEQTRALSAFAQRNGLTASTVVQGAWAVLLARHSGRDDVVFGTTVSGRPAELAGVESMVGVFINTVPTRIDVADDRDLLAWLREVQQAQARRFDHVSLAQLSRWAELPAGVNLFDSIVVFENYPFDQDALGLRITETGDVQPTSYPLTVVVEPGARLSVGMDYDAARFDQDTVEELARRLLLLLTEITRGLARTVGDLALLAPDAAVRMAGRGGDRALPEGGLAGLFAEQVRRSPHAVAVRSPQETLTYRELDARANRLAHQLVELGIAADRPVGVLSERSVELVVAELAVVKAGGAYLPVDVRAPRERMAVLLVEAGAVALITDRAWAETGRMIHSGPTVVVTDTALADRPATDPAVAVHPDNLAYVMYTSGSTGRPKGVAVRQRDVVALALDTCFDGPAHRCTLLHSPAAFDASTYELWVPLLRGGQVVVAPSGDVEIDTVRRMVTGFGVTALWLTAGLFRLIAQDAPDALRGSREVWTGGDVVPAAAVRKVMAACPDLTVVDGYGPTETTTFAAHHVLPPKVPVPELVPIGRPQDNMRVYVLDHRLRPVPSRVAGELYLAGAGLARGYLGQPGLTAQRFLPDPFGPPGERMYATGDVVRWNANGELEFVGRGDDQVKIRGFRIEPGEIEAALTAHPNIAEAVVTAIDDGDRKRLVGYVVGAGVEPAALRTHLAAALPDYMVPAAFVMLETLPLSRNGKLDRSALPAPVFDAPRTGYLPPRTPAEETLAEIWAEVLGVDRVGVSDNFFELGGDSILTIQVVSRARQAGLALLPRDVFRSPTVAALAASAAEADTVSVDQGPVTGDVPLTPIQRWYLAQNPAEPAHFDQSITVELRDDTDLDALARALTALLAHHDALRMRFTRGADGWHQHNAPVEPVDVLHRHDLTASLDPAGAARTIVAATHRGFDLAHGPLLRAELLDFGDRQELLLAVHHLVVDGVSWRILLADLDRAYQQARVGAPIELGAKTTSYRDWASRLDEIGAFAEDADYWHSVVDGAEVAIPVDADDPNTLESVRAVTVRLDEHETSALLRDVPPVYRTRINDVLLAALGRVLTGWTGHDRVLVDLEGHGREPVDPAMDVSRTVGWFTSMYPVALSGAPDWGDALKATKENLRAVPHHGILSPIPVTAAVSFNYLGQFDSTPSGPYARVGPLESELSEQASRSHMLEIVGAVEHGALGFTWYYSANKHRERTVAGLAEQLTAALREIVAHCARPETGGHTPSDFPLARLDQAIVDRIAGTDVDDVYPLTPMQAGMMFHGLSQQDQSVYFEQVSFTLSGVDDLATLHSAWQQVVDRTPVLRSRLVWTDVDEPLQVVLGNVTVPVTHLDWTGVDDQAAALESLLARDRAQGMELSTAPLTRVTIARCAADEVVVLWTFHHVLLDGWSVFAVLSDLFAAVRGASLPQRRPFREYLGWLADQDRDAAQAYWRGVLAGFDAPTPLPVDHRPCPGHANTSSEWLPVELSRAESDRLYAFARQHRLTVNAVVQGAWALALSRYSGRTDVCFGATVSGRPADLPGADEITGIFINTLPVRLDATGTESVLDWLHASQRAQADARRFDYVSLTDLARWSDLPAGTNPFESIVVFENYPINDDVAQAQGLRLRDLRANETTNYPLSIVVSPHQRLFVELGYDSELFEQGTVARMATHLIEILRAFVAAPEQPLGQVELLTDAERARLAAWNATDRAITPTTLPALFEAQVARTPALTALSWPGGELSYSRLNVAANQLAHQLIAGGAGPGRIVALALPRSPEIALAAIAVAKTGAAFLPIDPVYPAERIEFMLADSAPSLTITDLDLAELTGPAYNPTDIDRAGPLHLDHPAYVIYTSGSTGQPKGVLVPHRGISNFAGAEIEHLSVAPGDRVLQFASPSFDASILELLLALTSGATLVSPPDGPLLGDALAELLAEQRITHALIPPAALGTLPVRELPRFQHLVVGGDACSAELVARWAPGRQLVNAYGPTETTVVATWSDPLHPTGVPPAIGAPIANTRVHLLDAEMRAVPIGSVGEVYVSSPGLALGYLNQPGLTADRFVAAPNGTRRYRTGDLARWDTDGQLHYLGRTDHQVKIRGHRVEPREVEAALLRHRLVEQAVVVPRADSDGQLRLIGYVVSTAPPEELLAFLRRRLPAYLVPAAIQPVDAFPLTANGKLDRAALPEPALDAPVTEHTPPDTDTERALAEIWADVLGVRTVGRHDDFFALGGDSVRSVLITARTKTAFGVTITPKDVLTAGTVRALADVVEEQVLRELEQLAADES